MARRSLSLWLTLLLVVVGRVGSYYVSEKYEAQDNKIPNQVDDRHFTGSRSTLSSVRCPSHQKELYFRNETGSFIPLTNANDQTYKKKGQEYFHPCWCTHYFHRPVEYCPSSTPICKVPKDGPVECMSHSGRSNIASIFWPTGFFYIGVVLLVWVSTKRGGYTYHYIRRKLFHRNDEEGCLIEQANHLLAQDGRPHLLGEEFVRREQQQILREQAQRQNTSTPKPKRKKIKRPMALRTKSFSIPATSDASDLENDIDDYECAICLGLLENGDVVGDIPCGHLFHKDCLRVWIKQRTRCPLCQDESLVSDPANDRRGDREIDTSDPISVRALGMMDSESASDGDAEVTSEASDVEEMPIRPDVPSTADDQV